jgi:bla regulator protein BlaR1
MNTRFILAALAVLLLSATHASPQPLEGDTPAFEVATVRENTSGDARSRIEVVNARFSAINMTLRELVSIVYPTEGGRFRHASQLVGGPGWFNSARFDIIARAEGFRGDTNRPGFTATDAERESVERVRLMMRRLLAERFKLRARTERRQMPIYELVMLKPGQLGPEMKRSPTDCMEEWKKQGMPDARGLPCGSIQGARVGRMTGHAAEIGPLVRDLYDWTGRPVMDRTGLTGRFDFTLNWAPEGSTDTDAPSIFTAVQEQLGLKLQPARGAVEVLVVDSVDRPIPD